MKLLPPSLFQESRHAHGMRCLGIPNTAHFANVTSIQDAMSCKCPGSVDGGDVVTVIVTDLLTCMI